MLVATETENVGALELVLADEMDVLLLVLVFVVAVGVLLRACLCW